MLARHFHTASQMTMMKTIKRWLWAIPLFLLAAPAHADYRPGDFGIGIGSGTMTRLGFSFKNFMNDNAVQVNLEIGRAHV